ncbi:MULTISPECIES: cation transporter [unclassified Rhodococcus (in: high G+C Gram-positive bacteria)]|uniref:cation transporter n=1 Tax=unclassified Rhodococcus (in: high G+C Gram-positive bacteria) TaxID=192944 RepID=UPI00146B28B6|nr:MULTISPECIES: cation transporter [unclassified Rhodococcus (in: high G+C Gram-positive bacteria)]MBF0660649.1 heavy-metal-associated domain-containing protein [Rhodococcus sp. (in: high G+C Gram-positive bacteria)]NMD94155.1 heavy-metal-associated domain-containing protein [Rhodococcus sp. BL-253-APC-6A1W]NME77599.1 heavy-metal-associated domain-containing protein [Rhodococcus sp. 105337]
MQTTYRVEGMTCGHCVAAVEEEVGALDGVTAAKADLETGQLVVDSGSEPDRAAVAAAVDEAGYALAP